MVLKTSSARQVLSLEIKALKKQEEMQTRLEKLRCQAKEMEKAGFQKALSRKARIAEIERLLAKVSNSCESSFRSISPVDSFTEDLRLMDKTETTENGVESSSTFDSRECREICSQRKIFRV